MNRLKTISLGMGGSKHHRYSNSLKSLRKLSAALLAAGLPLAALAGYWLEPEDYNGETNCTFNADEDAYWCTGSPGGGNGGGGGGTQAADMVMYGGKIYTADQSITDPTQRFVEAVAVQGNTIVFAGTKAELDSTYNVSAVPSQNNINLNGALAVPGFHDIHMHPLEGGDYNYTCILTNNQGATLTITEAKRTISRCTAGSHGFILGWGHNIEDLVKEAEMPKAILDSVQPTTPVVIMESTSHSAWVNSAALARMGINAGTPDPQGGHYVKAASGELTGILLDSAGDQAFHYILDNPSTTVANDTYTGFKAIMDDVVKNGISTFVNARLYYKRNYQDLWKKGLEEGAVKARAHMALWVYPNNEIGDATDAEIAAQVNEIKNIASTYSNGLLQFDHVKMYSDGLPLNTTADFIDPYEEPYATNMGLGVDTNNRNYLSSNDMAKYIAEFEKAGFTAIIHTIGDLGVRKALDAVKAGRALNANAYNDVERHRLTHVEHVDNLDIARFASENVIADAQVAGEWSLPGVGHRQAEEQLLGTRMDHQIPLGKIHNALAADSATKGALTLSSDWDVSSMSPLVGIEHSLRRGVDGSMPNIYASVDAYTAKAAYALGNENKLGQIKPGMLADFTVIDQDIFSITDITKIAPSSTDNQGARVIKTIVDGKVVYSGN